MVGNSVWELVKASDGATITILLLLLCMSLICWSVFFYKLLLLNNQEQIIAKASHQIGHIKSLDGFVGYAAQYKNTLPGIIFDKSITTVSTLLQTPFLTKNELSERDYELYSLVMDKTLDETMQDQQEYMGILSATAAVSPLLGLFGTVWGLIHAFLRISEKQSADIVTVAPGVAEALITTLAGLLVAIPALIMFHYLQVRLRALDMKLSAIADACTWIVRHIFVR
jgi:biopolymer transport protein TolQ